jgi:hypothetical protein
MDELFKEEKPARSVDFRRELIDGTENRLNSVPVELAPFTPQTNSESFDSLATAADAQTTAGASGIEPAQLEEALTEVERKLRKANAKRRV